MVYAPKMDLFNNDPSFKARYKVTNANYAIDTSGSTAGNILLWEKMSAEQMMEYIKCERMISWNSIARIVNGLDKLCSEGMTVPVHIVPFIHNAKMLILYTDGFIHETDMKNFQMKLATIPKIPIMVIFTLSGSYHLGSTITEMQQQIDMSIPEACIAMSDDVCLILNIQGQHKILMQKGSFPQIEILELTRHTTLNSLPDFDMSSMNEFSIKGILPQGQIWLDDLPEPLVLEKLYNCTDIPFAILDLLYKNIRMYLPVLDLDRFHRTLDILQKKVIEDPKLTELRDQLFKIATTDKAGSDEHRALIKEYTEHKKHEHSKQIMLIHKLFKAIADYRISKTDFILGSNRAYRAKELTDVDIDHLGNTCFQIECPILLEEGDACILIKAPPENNDYIKSYTEDYAIDSPFDLGKQMAITITPGVYCHEIAKTLTTNPLTREPIIGYLPLSKGPNDVMKHMAKLFTGKRVMWHMIPAYISMLIHATDRDWIDADLFIETAKELSKNYNTNRELKENIDNPVKVSLYDAFEYVTTNYATLLRDRAPYDIKAIVRVTETVRSQKLEHRMKILGMANVIELFAGLLIKLKNKIDLRNYIMEVDDYGHHVKPKTDTKALIATLFWKKGENYINRKMQIAIDIALNDPDYGEALKLAFNGEPFDEDLLTIAYPEPDGIHFDENRKFNAWTEDGLPKDRCIYCGEYFDTPSDLWNHCKEVYGKHMYNGHKTVREVITEFGKDTPEIDLFKETKNRLFKKYGEDAPFLHTQKCKMVLLDCIRRFKK